ncbi:hypothetical protein FORC065_2193 [Yersinia enterocolitica]|nr:hypothetical protein FORC065_2193 [Yersinia enterocolitica]
MTLFENEDELNNTHSDYASIIKNNRDNISVTRFNPIIKLINEWQIIFYI